ncbi:N-substituted formamide deformylase [Brevundimonas sp. NIBR10]|uniref:amidohydrolase family protein n=1 Tax=Brevundimonas sp. NIBR10 TaxID=3015997 RepID=UPI0022F17C47|nr:amidohydrolase family protein [Brevundimonas sp. NIBR10]WGM47504.1 N-substituted formamide deformylase [Brevundimonas sp. NIBR10]
MIPALLIRGATLLDGRSVDVRIVGGLIVEIGSGLDAADARVIEAEAGLLIPGLHDHHVHVAATAAARTSVKCGPPDVVDREGLARCLSMPGIGWLRGVGYHESVAGMLDRVWLDQVAPERPVRIQHRSGRMWFLNTAALETLLAPGVPLPSGLDRVTGRLFDEDAWMQQVMAANMPAFDDVGAEWSRLGVTGITEMSPANDDRVASHFVAERERGALPQSVVLAGQASLGAGGMNRALKLGPVKIHLHEADMPDFDTVVSMMRKAHAKGRTVAVHCVSELELVFTLAALRDAGVEPGDRIEHASICPDHLLQDIADQGLSVVAQPNFVSERGDAYRQSIAPDEWSALYRLQSFVSAGVTLAGGTDVPFGDPDPWAAMAAAVSRRTLSGHVIGACEAMSPEQALSLFTADPVDLRRQRYVEVGCAASLCLLTRPWTEVRNALSAADVRATVIEGRVIYDRVDQAPVQGGLGVDASA